MISRSFSVYAHHPKTKVLELLAQALGNGSSSVLLGGIDETGFELQLSKAGLVQELETSQMRLRRQMDDARLLPAGANTGLAFVAAKTALRNYGGPLPLLFGEMEEDGSGTTMRGVALLSPKDTLITLLPVLLAVLIVVCGFVFPESLVLELGIRPKMFVPFCIMLGAVGVLFTALNIKLYFQNVKRAKEVLRFLLIESADIE